MVEPEKVNKLLQHISTNNIRKLNKEVYTGARLVNDKVSISHQEIQTEIQNLDWTWGKKDEQKKLLKVKHA